MRRRSVLLIDEEVALLVEGLEAVQRRTRDKARPRRDRKCEYCHVAARDYNLAGELAKRLTGLA